MWLFLEPSQMYHKILQVNKYKVAQLLTLYFLYISAQNTTSKKIISEIPNLIFEKLKNLEKRRAIVLAELY